MWACRSPAGAASPTLRSPCAAGHIRRRRVTRLSARRRRGNRRRFGAGGKSELHRARGQVTPGQRELEDSATERRTPARASARRRTCPLQPSGREVARQETGNGLVSLKGCGKSAPAARAIGSARQTPSGATPNRTRAARLQVRVGGLSRSATTGLEEWFPPADGATRRRHRTPLIDASVPLAIRQVARRFPEGEGAAPLPLPQPTCRPPQAPGARDRARC